jgi:flagellar hook-basal body complex protein FliE
MSDLKIQPPAAFEPLHAPSGGGAATAPTRPGVDFGELVKRSIDSVNATQQDARVLAERFEVGDPNVDLVRVMVEMQKARVSFEAMSQVRNKLVEAYREIMNMQV